MVARYARILYDSPAASLKALECHAYVIAESGEEMFERVCNRLGWTFSRIEEASRAAQQRPDYRVIGSDGSAFIAEVKTIMPNADEARDIARFERGEVFATGGTPGHRMRRLIASANQQLKALAAGVPGLLVVFNPEILLHRHTDPYSILTAMRGLDVIDVEVPRDMRESPRFGELRSGPGKKMTTDANTSTSAVVCPSEVAKDEWTIGVYHNRHAIKPLSMDAMSGPSIAHLCIASDERQWVRCPAL
jgi:hypothetical protein